MNGLTGGPSTDGLGYQANAKSIRPLIAYPTDLKERLTLQITDLDRKRGELVEALALLERNPDTERLLSLLGRF